MDKIKKKKESFLAIDQHKLDREWLRQPELYFKYANKLADRRNEYDSAKTKLTLTEARVSSEVRANPDGYELTKTTEGAIQNVVQSHVDVVEATTNLRVCRHAVDVISAAVEALDHRRRALENLVRLHAANYFSEPKIETLKEQEAVDNMIKENVRSRS